MNEKILALLAAKFQGASESVLSRIAAKLAKTVKSEEEAKAAVDGYTWQQLIDSYADSRATEAAQTAVHNYEQKHGLKDGAKIEGEPKPDPTSQQQNTGDEVPEWAKALVESNRKLTERLSSMEAERTTASRRQQLSAVTGKLPENLRKGYDRTPVEGLSDEQFTALMGEISSEVEGIVRSTQQKGVVFGRPGAAHGGTEGTELSKEQQEAIAHREGIHAGDGQPF